MVSNRSIIPSQSELPEVVDDLKRIKGIGQGVETRLNQAGILSFAQLATSSPEQISGVLADMIGMSPQKIEEQDWIGQAKQFAAETEPDEAVKIPMSSVDQQHYETFSVKLLVDEGNQVRRTNIVHVQKGMEENWAGWDETRLIAFVVENAALNFASIKTTIHKTTIQMNVESVPATEADAYLSPSEILRFPIETTNIRETGSGRTSNIFATDQDWSIRLGWTVSGIELSSGNWQVKAYLESMGAKKKDYAPPGVSLPIVPNRSSYSSELKFKAGEMAPGIYWLVVTIASENAMEVQPGKLVPVHLMGFAEKSMLQFYER